MEKQEIIDTIRTYKKYSGKNFFFSDDHVLYFINGKEYKIEINNYWSKLTFSYSAYMQNIIDCNITINKDKANIKNIRSKFREVVRYLDRLDIFLTNRQLHENKIKPVISEFIKKEWCIENAFEDKENIIFKINFPDFYVKGRRRGSSSRFNVLKENTENVRYNINLTFRSGQFNISLIYIYSAAEKKLLLQQKEEYYKEYTKDITKIIRAEKLKNLFIKNEDSN
jgi:hypothetical protein